jgi:hypothetical protein
MRSSAARPVFGVGQGVNIWSMLRAAVVAHVRHEHADYDGDATTC